jgi:hypothetical protein
VAFRLVHSDNHADEVFLNSVYDLHVRAVCFKHNPVALFFEMATLGHSSEDGTSSEKPP